MFLHELRGVGLSIEKEKIGEKSKNEAVAKDHHLYYVPKKFPREVSVASGPTQEYM